MVQTTHEQNPSDRAQLFLWPPSSGAWAGRAAWAPVAVFGAIALLTGGDIVSDVVAGASAAHVAAEGLLVVLSVVAFVYLWAALRQAKARARDLERDLDGTRADLARWRSEAQTHLRGLGAAIERQFERWQLTPAEAEVALLLLKGLSLKEIADLRETSERTVRQQSLAVYRKADLAGRAELAAFFLEDLLLPRDVAEPSSAAGG